MARTLTSTWVMPHVCTYIDSMVQGGSVPARALLVRRCEGIHIRFVNGFAAAELSAYTPDLYKVFLVKKDSYDHSAFVQQQGWIENKRPGEFFPDTRCFVKGKNIVLITEGAMTPFTQNIMPVILPVVMDLFKQYPLTQKEVALLSALRSKDYQKRDEILEEIAEELDIAQKANRFVIQDLSKRIGRCSIDRKFQNLKYMESAYHDKTRELRDLWNQIKETQYLIAGMKMNEHSDDELFGYLTSNPKIQIGNIDEDSDGILREFSFYVCGILSYWDTDLAKRLIESKCGYLYPDPANVESMNGLCAIYKALFLQQFIRLRISAEFKFRLDDGYVSASGTLLTDFTSGSYNNPHIGYFSCLGDNQSEIEKCIVNADVIGAIEQCIAATESLNLSDSVVMGKFANDLYHSIGLDAEPRMLFVSTDTEKIVKPSEIIDFVNKRR